MDAFSIYQHGWNDIMHLSWSAISYEWFWALLQEEAVCSLSTLSSSLFTLSYSGPLRALLTCYTVLCMSRKGTPAGLTSHHCQPSLQSLERSRCHLHPHQESLQCWQAKKPLHMCRSVHSLAISLRCSMQSPWPAMLEKGRAVSPRARVA